MMETYFRSARVKARLRRSHLGSVVDDLVAHLAARGHAQATVQQYLQAVEHFDRWLRRTHCPVTDVNEATVRRFLEKHLPRCQCPPPRTRTLHQARAALKHLLAVLRQTGRTLLEPLETPAAKLVAEFAMHLRDRRGATRSTCTYYIRYAQEFLDDQFGTGAIDFSQATPAAITAFLGARHGRWCTASMKVAATALRSFLRYLWMTGHTRQELACAVPRIPLWRLSSVPRVLDDAQVHAVLTSFDRNTPIGLRGYASTLCLALLGMRTSEVSVLTLDDIDWRAATIRVPATKTRRADILPLPDPVARAILAYLRRGRPQTKIRQIFVRHAPPGALAGPAVVRNAVRLACARAGLDPRIGPHAFRHTVATRMLQAGASLKEVADILRHRSIDTTTVYAKVDLTALRDVAAPWPRSEP